MYRQNADRGNSSSRIIRRGRFHNAAFLYIPYSVRVDKMDNIIFRHSGGEFAFLLFTYVKIKRERSGDQKATIVSLREKKYYAIFSSSKKMYFTRNSIVY